MLPVLGGRKEGYLIRVLRERDTVKFFLTL